MAGRSLSIRCVALLVLVSLSSARCWSWPPFTGIGDASTASNFQEEQKAEDLIRKDRRGSPFDADGHSLATAHTRLKERRLLNPAEPQASPSCWQTAYNQLSASCRQIIRDESLKSHLAIRFSNCFLRASGRRVIACKEHMAVEMCTRGMSDHEHAIYLAFFLDVEAECHHLQSEAFKQEVEDTVNALKVSAQWLEDELSTMVDQSEAILENSAESLTAQRQLAEQQALMDASFKDGLSSLGDVTRDIKFGLDEMDKAQRQFAALQAQQGEVLVQAMANLDSQARQLGSSMEKHAAGQEQMLKSQAEALQLVLHIKHLQRTAMDDQKAAIEQLAKLAKIHQTETATWHKEMARSQTSLLNGHTKVAAELAELSGAAEEHHVATRDWFNEMDNAHSRLAEGAAAILAAQEDFVVKQADMFSSLDRIFTLCGALVHEAQTTKAFLFYVVMVLLTYFFTSVPRTREARLVLIAGICAAFAMEFHLSRGKGLADSTTTRNIRLTFLFVGAFVICLFAITYRDPGVAMLGMLKDHSRQLLHLLQAVEGKQDCQGSHIHSYGGRSQEMMGTLNENFVLSYRPLQTGNLLNASSDVETENPWNRRNLAKRVMKKAMEICRRVRGEGTMEFLAMSFDADEDEVYDPDYVPDDGYKWSHFEERKQYNLRPRLK